MDLSDVTDTLPESPAQLREGPVARTLEKVTGRVPSDVFLWAAFGAMAISLIQQLRQPRRMSRLNAPSRSGQLGLFFGQWVPTLLLFGVYNKIVKAVGGSDRVEAELKGDYGVPH